MKNIVFVFVSLILLVVVAGQAQYCNTCLKMVADIKEQFNNDFRKVGVNNIVAAMSNECSLEMAGFEGQICRTKVRQNACKLLKFLRQNATNAQACAALGLC